MTGESNPEERPVDSTAGETESEPPVLVDADSSESAADTESSDSVASSETNSETPQSDSSESSRLGSLDPTVRVKRPDASSEDGDDPAESSEGKNGDDSGTDSEAARRARRPSAKTPAALQASQRRQTPAVSRDGRRPQRASPSSAKPDMMANVLQSLQQLTTRTTHLESNTQKIARALVEIVKEGENRKRAYDVLYDEMRQYKENFLWQCQKPLFMDLITLFDSILRVERQYEAMDGMDKVAGDFRYLKDELLETLYRYDVELIEEHPDRLDIGFQKPIKRVHTDDPSEDRAVVKIVREGFAREGMILRPQEIVVKRYSESKEG